MQQIISETKSQTPVFVGKEFKKNGNSEPAPFKWTKKEYHQMAELGMFEGRRTEFIEGEIIEMPQMKSPHATGLTLTDNALRGIFSKNFVVRNQMPLDFGEEYEPVPDIVIVNGNPRDYLEDHPKTAELLVEISDTTLSYDRNRKASLYAKFGIQDYWILNLKNRTLEVYRQPIEDENTFYGFNYGEKLTLDETREVSPLAKSDAEIKIADLLP